jgi:Replication protein A interacting C-terminal
MTATASSLNATKKSPISATKSWNKVRRACIERLRQNKFCTPEKSTPAFDAADLPLLRYRVEDQLRRFGIVVESPCSDENDSNIMRTEAEDDGSAIIYQYNGLSDIGTNLPIADHYITEEELFDLLQDLENEMEQEKLMTFEEMKACETDYLDQQIADYEQWEETKLDIFDSPLDYGLLCPLCQEANVVLTPSGGIVCLNHMGGTCLMEINDVKGLQIGDLKCRMGNAIATHNCNCEQQLSFSILQTGLIGYCSTCSSEYLVV